MFLRRAAGAIIILLLLLLAVVLLLGQLVDMETRDRRREEGRVWGVRQEDSWHQ